MDDLIETMMVSVRADTAGFARDVAAMKATLDGPLVTGADRAGRAIETSLLRAVRSGKLGFEDLKGVALSAMASIAASALRSGLESILGGASAGGGLVKLLSGLIGGAPGRATGGPVSPGRAYMVGERGPELFVPTASGSVATASGSVATASGGGQRDVRVAITVNAAGGDSPAALAKSSAQVARAVKAALMQVDD